VTRKASSVGARGRRDAPGDIDADDLWTVHDPSLRSGSEAGRLFGFQDEQWAGRRAWDGLGRPGVPGSRPPSPGQLIGWAVDQTIQGVGPWPFDLSAARSPSPERQRDDGSPEARPRPPPSRADVAPAPETHWSTRGRLAKRDEHAGSGDQECAGRGWDRGAELRGDLGCQDGLIRSVGQGMGNGDAGRRRRRPRAGAGFVRSAYATTMRRSPGIRW